MKIDLNLTREPDVKVVDIFMMNSYVLVVF